MSPDEARGSMLVLGGLSGAGSNFNVVSGNAWFTVDARVNPEEDLDRELKHITGLIEDAAAQVGARVTVKVTQLQPAASTDPTHPTALALAHCVSEVDGVPPRVEMCAGILDTRWYNQRRIPAFAFGPGRLDVSHGPHEYVDEGAMQRCAAVYALYARTLLS